MTGTFVSSAGSGFALGLSLIIAIGAQNAFVLRQGLRRAHVFAVSLTCAASDSLLIAAGIAGFGLVVETVPWFAPAMTWGGVAFLAGYGMFSFRRAFGPPETLRAAEDGPGSLRWTLMTCLALTWLNPHVYLDTVVLLGSVGAQFDNRLAFGLGAIAASFGFFFALGYGARLLAPVFDRPVAWRVLDAAMGCVMWAIAAALVAG